MASTFLHVRIACDRYRVRVFQIDGPLQGMSQRMRKWSKWIATACAIWIVILPMLAQAQIFQPFQPRYSGVLNGDLVMVSNTSVTCAAPANGSCPAVQNKNDQLNMVNSKLAVDAADASIFNSSSADLTSAQLPAGAQVVKAELYWGGLVGSTAGAPNPGPAGSPVRLARPGASYQSITPQGCDVSPVSSIWGQAAHHLYACRADVTPLVQSAGTYRVANLPLQVNALNRFGGWTLVLVIRNPASPMRRFTINDGLAAIATTGTNPVREVSVDIGGFRTPLAGPVTAQLGWMALDGDLAAADGFTFTGQGSATVNLGDACNPVGDVFNSTICNFGTPVLARSIVNGNGTNTLGFDADLLQLPNPGNVNLRNGATSARLTARTSSEGYGIAMLALAVDVYQPSFDATTSKVQANLTHPGLPAGQALPGDRIRYTVTLSNIGEDNAQDVVLRDAIPTGTDYEPGSLEILVGANPGAKTDIAGDDQGELAGGQAVFRVGTGANATQGGVVRCTTCQGSEPTDITVTFVVKVKDDAAPGAVIRNTAQLQFVGVSSGETFTETSNETVLRVQAPPRLTLRKIINGRARASDQFTLAIGPGGPTATSSGTATSIATTPFVASPGTTYTLTETGAGSPAADLASYNISYSCVNVEGGTTDIPAGTGPSISVTPVNGDDITCTFTNTRNTANLSITKTNTPASGANDQPGDTVTLGATTDYTIVVTNNGPDAADGAVVRDTPNSNLNCTAVRCDAATGGAACPAVDVAGFFGGGVSIATLPAGGAVTFVATCTVR